MKNIKFRIYILSFLIILFVSGCQNSKVSTNNFQIKTHIENEENSNIIIDAKVEIPEILIDGKSKRVKGTPLGYLEKYQIVENLVVGNREISKQYNDSSHLDCAIEYTDGAALTLSENMIFFATSLGGRIYEYLELDRTAKNSVKNIFSTKFEFSDFSRTEAYNRITKICNGFGITLSSEYVCYAFDSESIEKTDFGIGKSENGDIDKMVIPNGEYYYFFFRNIYNNTTLLTTEDIYLGTGTPDSCLAIIGKEELELLSLRHIYQTEVSDTVNLVSVDEAVKVVEKKYKDQLLSQPVKVIAVELCYYADDERQYNSVTPIYMVWSFEIIFSENGPPFRVLVHAETGREILIGDAYDQ